MTTKRWIAIIAAVVLLVFSIGFRFAMNFASGVVEELTDMDTSTLSEETEEDGDMSNRIAVLNLEGTIQEQEETFVSEGYQHEAFMDSIEQAAEDETIKGIVLNINSPGGAVGATEDIHKALKEIQDDYEKPIYVSMGETAASGGYYSAASADKIFAKPSTLTGSIGVIMQSTDFSGLAEKYGVKFNTIKSGKYKDIMSPTKEMTDEEEDILQSMVDEMYDEFVQVIVDGRDMDEEKVRELGDGRVYTGKQAEENGLVDEVGDFDDTLAAMKEDNDLEDAAVVSYGYDMGIFGKFNVSMQNLLQGKDKDLEVVSKLMDESDRPRAMYLY